MAAPVNEAGSAAPAEDAGASGKQEAKAPRAAGKKSPAKDDTAADIVKQLEAEGVGFGIAEEDAPTEAKKAKTKESDEPAEDADEAEPAKEDDKVEAKDAKEEKDKESTYQRNKRRLDEARRERDAARKAADDEAERAESLRAEIAFWRKQAEEERHARDSLSQEARAGRLPAVGTVEEVDLRRQLAEYKAAQEVAQRQRVAQERAAMQRAVRAEQDSMRGELNELADKYGVERAEVLKEFILMSEAGREEPLEAIARRQAGMLAYRRAQQAEAQARAQAARSGSAPPLNRGVQPRAATGPRKEDTSSEIAAFLRAEGLF